jgi:hypothetical protein
LPAYYDPPRFHASFAWRLPAEVADTGWLEALDDRLGRQLRESAQSCSTLCLKVGKQVERWSLTSP